MTETTTTKSLVNYDEIISSLNVVKTDVNLSIVLCQTDTLKKAKETLTILFNGDKTANLPIKIKDEIKALHTCKTKKVFLEETASLVERLDNNL